MPPPNGYNGFSHEITTPDLHLKMSKKIAQLTKVIYALNTKADEHEAVVEAIEARHEESMSRLIQDSQAKLATFSNRLQDQAKLTHQIHTLQAKADELDRVKKDRDSEMNDIKTAADEQITRLKVEHSNTILSLSKQLETAKSHFQKQLAQFQTSSKALLQEKDNIIDKLEQAHLAETETLKKSLQDRLDLIKDSESSTSARVQELEQKLHESGLELECLREAHRKELQDLADHHRKELEIAKSDESNVQQLQQELLLAKEDSKTTERTLKMKINELQSQMQCSNDECDRLRQAIKEREAELSAGDGERAGLAEQQESLRSQLHQASSENSQLRDTVVTLQATAEQNNQLISQLQGDASELERAVVAAQTETRERELELSVARDNLACLESDVTQLTQHNQTLLQQLSDDQAAWHKSADKLRQQLSEAESAHQRQVAGLREEQEAALEELRANHERELADERRRHQTEVDSYLSTNSQLHDHKTEFEKRLKKELANFERERTILHDQMEKLQKDHEAQINHLNSKLNSASEELDKLREQLRLAEKKDKQSSERADKAERQLGDSQAQLSAKGNELDTLQKLLEKTKKELEEKLVNERQEAAQKLIVTESELNERWNKKLSEELRCQADLLSNESNQQISQQLMELERQKQSELHSLRSDLEEKLREAELKLTLQDESTQKERSMAENEILRLKRQLKGAEETYEQDVRKVRSEYEREMEKLREVLNKEIAQQASSSALQLQALEERLTKEHEREMTSLRDALTSQAESDRATLSGDHALQVERLETQHASNIEQLKKENTERHMHEVQKLTEGFNSQIAHLKKEIESVTETKRRLDSENQSRVKGMKEELSHRNALIAELEGQVAEARESALRLGGELEFKDQVIQRVKAESQQHLRKVETEVEERYKGTMNDLEADHIRATQKLTQEHARQAESLKQELRDTKAKLRAAHERYENRESRPEDLHSIQQLQHRLDSQDERMKQLVAEKEYYQRELVNRETNFNKVFNSSPNVGVLNPLSVAKKTQPGSSSSTSNIGSFANSGKYASSSTGSTPPARKLSTPPGGRLDPLPQSSNPRYTPTPPRVPKKFL